MFLAIKMLIGFIISLSLGIYYFFYKQHISTRLYEKIVAGIIVSLITILFLGQFIMIIGEL